MFLRVSFITFLVLCYILLSVPAHAATQNYSWQDASGVITFSDIIANAPSDAQLTLFSTEYSDPEAVAETGLTETDAAEIPERPLMVVTQGEFAIQLVRELGLGKPSSGKEAADILTSARIAPQLGLWELDQPMTSELTTRLRTLTVAASKRGWITTTPEQVLLAFDTAAALLDAPIPATPAPETPESPSSSVEAPPLVYLYPPPPEIYPYYLWVPVAGGFWFNDFIFPGFFSLNVDLFFFNHHRFFFRNHFFAVNVSIIQRHFLGHIVIADHRFGGRILATPRAGRPPSGVRSASVSNRMMNPPIRPRQGLRPSGLHRSGIQPHRQFGSNGPRR